MSYKLSLVNFTSKEKGIIISFEAILALMLFTLMIFALPQQESSSMKELLALQQANDLLKVWSASETSEQEMISDTKQMFSTNAELGVNEKQLLSAKKHKNSIATEGEILDKMLNEQKIRIVIYFE